MIIKSKHRSTILERKTRAGIFQGLGSVKFGLMASPGSLLEMKLMEVGLLLLRPPSTVEELLSLLDRTETLLSVVEQSPSSTMTTSLFPTVIALVSKEIFIHQDEDIKLGVASCISEITRITSPEVPYDYDLMKEAFQRIVEAFEKLDDMTSQSYPRRVSILETVAKVRSSVVMLDLECDALILEMFRHFLRTIGSNNSENVFFLMENIMTFVLEECEDIPSEFLSCLLTSLKKDSKNILPTSRRLAEKVIANCGAKLKPYLVDTLNSTGVPLSDYCDIVASICQGKSDDFDQDGLEPSNEHLNFGKENNKDLNETLVGSKIKVWWPEDKLFYHGIVEAFEPTTKRHKVVYSDGDVEILLLKNERYELIEEGQDELTRSPNGPSKGWRGKKTKCSESVPRAAKKETLLKRWEKSRSVVEGFNSKNGSYIRKLRGKPKVIYPTCYWSVCFFKQIQCKACKQNSRDQFQSM
ncbi:uncharacterized protein LOC120264291 isoform X1 [Dioscorea cayenensis subsp. rotundata]|uniref:Uncharacterized protein LOC120264291 isoform X1 n=2 Tax=Dioscorea cayennensis subsp. rotundata TaxID=55577 RepID=A0AB40BM48_DIOCR|nr:uncharacterized protein LOC120264291 isoform X1 [Dioscorea cayenensis subsp. rotundata]